LHALAAPAAAAGGIDPTTYLVEELRERMELVASGQFDLENSFDDFRVVVGDGSM
jgi:hypothetical protein